MPTYTVTYKCGCTCGHRHRSIEAARRCYLAADQHHADHADHAARCAPGRAWGLIEQSAGRERTLHPRYA